MVEVFVGGGCRGGLSGFWGGGGWVWDCKAVLVVNRIGEKGLTEFNSINNVISDIIAALD